MPDPITAPAGYVLAEDGEGSMCLWRHDPTATSDTARWTSVLYGASAPVMAALRAAYPTVVFTADGYTVAEVIPPTASALPDRDVLARALHAAAHPGLESAALAESDGVWGGDEYQPWRQRADRVLSALQQIAAPAGDPTAAPPERTYTGEFPPSGPATVDELVVDLHNSVTRVRIKYAAVVAALSEATGVPVDALLAAVDSATAERVEEEAATHLKPATT